MRNDQVIFSLAALLVGTLAGWFVDYSPRSMALGEGKAATSPARLSSAGHSPNSSVPADIFAERLHNAFGIAKHEKRERAITGIADDMTVDELRDALQRLGKIHVRERARIRTVLLARWGELDPTAAIRYAASLANLADRSPAVCAVIGHWVGKDPRAAEAWVVALPPGAMKTDALAALVEGLAVNEPHRALQLAQGNPAEGFGIPRYGHSNLVPSLFDKWLVDDPAAAADAAAKLPASAYFRDSALNLIARRWAEKDLARALAWAQSLGPNVDRSNTAMTGSLLTWLTKDPDAAMAWLNEYPDGDLKLGLVRNIASNLNSEDPALAMHLAVAIPSGIAREQSIDESMRMWLCDNPAAAAQWALQQDDTKTRRVALRRVAIQRLMDDPKEARDWITSLPPSAVKDTMLHDATMMIVDGLRGERVSLNPLLGTMSPESIQNSARVLSEISDTQIRMAACTALAAKWLSHDEPSARAWIESLPVSPAEKAELLKAKPKP
jgi:hypothetical protein